MGNIRRSCIVDNCVLEVYHGNKFGYCRLHLYRFKTTGNPFKTRKIIAKEKRENLKCDVNSCYKKVKSRIWCHTHYCRWLKYGDPLFTKIDMDNVKRCKIESCKKDFYAKEYCKSHYKMFENPSNHSDNRTIEEEIAKINVRKRDGSRCKWRRCDKSTINGDIIQVHHIFPRFQYPELVCIERFMICYCIDHHQEWHKARKDKCYYIIKVKM